MIDEVECRDCGELFDPSDPREAEFGFFDQCRDCSLEMGDDKKMVKAFTGFNKDGDWEGIEIVSSERFEEYRRVEELYSGKVTEDD